MSIHEKLMKINGPDITEKIYRMVHEMSFVSVMKQIRSCRTCGRGEIIMPVTKPICNACSIDNFWKHKHVSDYCTYCEQYGKCWYINKELLCVQCFGNEIYYYCKD